MSGVNQTLDKLIAAALEVQLPDEEHTADESSADAVEL